MLFVVRRPHHGPTKGKEASSIPVPVLDASTGGPDAERIWGAGDIRAVNETSKDFWSGRPSFR